MCGAGFAGLSMQDRICGTGVAGRVYGAGFAGRVCGVGFAGPNMPAAEKRNEIQQYKTMSEVINIKELNERIERESVFVDTLRTEMGKVIIGQSHLVDTLLIGLLSNGHILLEGVPGLAKTLAITTLAKAVDAAFSRIQFTPDLLPADLIGTLIYLSLIHISEPTRH